MKYFKLEPQFLTYQCFLPKCKIREYFLWSSSKCPSKAWRFQIIHACQREISSPPLALICLFLCLLSSDLDSKLTYATQPGCKFSAVESVGLRLTWIIKCPEMIDYIVNWLWLFFFLFCLLFCFDWNRFFTNQCICGSCGTLQGHRTDKFVFEKRSDSFQSWSLEFSVISQWHFSSWLLSLREIIRGQRDKQIWFLALGRSVIVTASMRNRRWP